MSEGMGKKKGGSAALRQHEACDPPLQQIRDILIQKHAYTSEMSRN